jgi:predicted DNA-binding transcriptional regulator AlpA
MASKELTIQQAMAAAERQERQQEQWAAQAQQQAEDTHLECYYDHIRPTELVQMWQSQRNGQGKSLSRFELRALVEQWCKRFGCLPPSDVSASAPTPSAPVEPAPEGTDMMSRRAVAKKLGVSVSSVQRLERDGRLPKAAHLGARGRRHLARDIDAFIAKLDEQRHAPRRER